MSVGVVAGLFNGDWVQNAEEPEPENCYWMINQLGKSAASTNAIMLLWSGLLLSQIRCFLVAVTVGFWYGEHKGSSSGKPWCPSCTT